MKSNAARREEIQKQLQLLKDQRDREQQAFDDLAAERVDLSAGEIAIIAQEKATIEAPSSVVVEDTVVAVDDYVRLLDDAGVLFRAEQGFLVADPVKRIYMGERGRVLRVLPSFQGKPAVELRFADGAEKIFFVECLEVGPMQRKGASSKQTVVGRAPAAGGEGVAAAGEAARPPATLPPAVEAAAVPAWGQLSIPGRNPVKKAVEAVPLEWPSGSPTITYHKDTTEIQAHRAPNALDKSEGATIVPRRRSFTTDAQSSLGLVKEVRPLLFTNHSCEDTGSEQLGCPLNLREVSRDPHGVDDLLVTPRPPIPVSAPTAGTRAPMPVEKSRIPKHCPLGYKAKYSLDNGASRIPRAVRTAEPGLRRCHIAGRLPNHVGQLQYRPLVLSSGLTSLDWVLRQATEVLEWRGKDSYAKRLFTEKGREILSADDIVDGMKLVASPGPRATTTNAVLAVNPHTGADFSGIDVSAGIVDVAWLPQKGRAAEVSRTGTTPVKVKASNALPTSAEVGGAGTPTMGGVSKPIHIRVYENGSYEDDRYGCGYRTVTVRPTYRTMASLKALVGRELLWRDGRRVDMLFDASGVEIDSLGQLRDGAAVVASAGDRFVIPYPNSALHREALQLSGM